MKQIFRFDSNGYYVGPVIIQDNGPLPVDCTDVQPPNGLYKGQFVNGSWVEGETSENILKAVKTTKKTELKQFFEASLFNGFTSNADGTNRIYAIDPVSMGKWTGALAVINAGKATSMTVKDFNGNKITLTSEQFQQMAADGFTFYNTQEARLWDLEDKIDADTTDTVDKVNAITW
jgi:hypothetical protein